MNNNSTTSKSERGNAATMRCIIPPSIISTTTTTVKARARAKAQSSNQTIKRSSNINDNKNDHNDNNNNNKKKFKYLFYAAVVVTLLFVLLLRSILVSLTQDDHYHLPPEVEGEVLLEFIHIAKTGGRPLRWLVPRLELFGDCVILRNVHSWVLVVDVPIGCRRPGRTYYNRSAGQLL